MRLGLFGGTFDPVHFGHLIVAECCREECDLDQVWFLPAATPPHKTGEAISAPEHRIEMLRLAIGGHLGMDVSTLETDRGGVNYSFQTLEALRAERPGDELFFLLGADSLHDLPNWREPRRICEAATLVVVDRPGAPAPDFGRLATLVAPERLETFRRHFVRAPQIELSGRDLRARVSQGRSIRFRTPRAVEKYIETHGLYPSN